MGLGAPSGSRVSCRASVSGFVGVWDRAKDGATPFPAPSCAAALKCRLAPGEPASADCGLGARGSGLSEGQWTAGAFQPGRKAETVTRQMTVLFPLTMAQEVVMVCG